MAHRASGTGWITITMHGPRTGAGLRVAVDGTAVEVTVPTTYVPVPAGRHQVELEASGGVTTYGEASRQVDLPPGGQIDLHYSLPRWLWGTGLLDVTAQPRSWSPDWRHIGIAVGGSLLLCCLCGTGVSVWELLTG